MHQISQAGRLPRHVAIIMDGNGRWARARNKPRIYGHKQGVKTVRRTVEHAAEVGVESLTLYAFSTDNWKRPATEVRSLMRLLRVFLRSETERCLENGVRVEVIGRRDRLPPVVVREMVAAN